METNRISCPTCTGARRITVMVPEVKTGTVYLNAHGFPAWPCDGGKPHRMRYHTGRSVARCSTCQTCNGVGSLADASSPDIRIARGPDGHIDEADVPRPECEEQIGVATAGDTVHLGLV